jgi:signal transduction histidine kinase/ActR/RegA family two-component response regulator
MKKKSHFGTKLFVVLLALSLLMMSAVTLLTYHISQSSTNLVIDEVRKRLEATAVAASNLVSYQQLGKIQQKEDAFSPTGEQLRSQLMDFANQMDLLFVYYIRLMPDGSEEFVIDSDTSSVTATYPGVKRVSVNASLNAAQGVVTSTELSEVDNFDFDAFSEYFRVTDEIKDISFISAYAPIYDENGNVAYLAGVDGLRYNLYQQEKQMEALTNVHMVTLVACCLFAIICLQIYRRRASQSEAASRAKSQFLSSMSHEIRTPLNTIIGMTDIAMRGGQTEMMECLSKIHYASNHLLTVVNDILDISKIQEQKLMISPANFKFEKMITSLTDSFKVTMQQKGLTFRCKIDPNIPTYLYGDDQRLIQVLMNLLSNAQKFTPIGGSITLSVSLISREGDDLCLAFSVRDTGIGISDANQARIFKPFEQADQSTTRQYGGTGLGLAISQSIVEAMSGSFSLTSEPGIGSNFSFEVNLKIGKPTDDSEQGNDLSKDKLDFTGKTLLIVDDMEINREIVVAMLEDTSVTILQAADGEEAVTMFQTIETIDAILMDVQMPKMDGLTATRHIRALGTPRALNIPIIAMTANALREDVDVCLAAGMNSHIGKPINWDNLISKLQTYLKE